MPLNKEAFIRYKVIDLMVRDSQKPYPSIEELIDGIANRLGKTFSKSCVQKDIKSMREDEALGFYAPIKHCKRKNGYYYTEEGYSIDRLDLSISDLKEIEKSLEWLNYFSQREVGTSFSDSINKVLLAYKDVFDQKSHHKKALFTESPVNQSGWKCLDRLYDACVNRLEVDIVHSESPKFMGDLRPVRFRPYVIKEFKGIWVLFGEELRSSGQLVLNSINLNNIYDLTVREVAFVETHNIDFEEYFASMYGVTTIGYGALRSVEKFQFKVNSLVVYELLQRPLNENQIIEKISKNEYLVTLEVRPTRDLMYWIRQFGSNVSWLNDNLKKWFDDQLDFDKTYGDLEERVDYLLGI